MRSRTIFRLAEVFMLLAYIVISIAWAFRLFPARSSELHSPQEYVEFTALMVFVFCGMILTLKLPERLCRSLRFDAAHAIMAQMIDGTFTEVPPELGQLFWKDEVIKTRPLLSPLQVIFAGMPIGGRQWCVTVEAEPSSKYGENYFRETEGFSDLTIEPFATRFRDMVEEAVADAVKKTQAGSRLLEILTHPQPNRNENFTEWLGANCRLGGSLAEMGFELTSAEINEVNLWGNISPKCPATAPVEEDR